MERIKTLINNIEIFGTLDFTNFETYMNYINGKQINKSNKSFFKKYLNIPYFI